jgi:alpha-mannosidase
MKITMVGNAHIDPVWLWRWQDGYAEVRATFRSALDRIAEFPGFVFTCSGALYYRWVEESDPAMFAEIRRRVDEGRWFIVGGWWIQPDCNLPCGETFARHSLEGQRWFASRFGRSAVVGYNVDSFGHNAQLPQVYAKSGMPFYVMMRPQEHEKELPGSLFWWEGLDGSRVLTYRIPINYASWWGEIDPVRQKALDVAAMAQAQRTDLMCFYGVGNHGGGPTRHALQELGSLQAEDTGHQFPFGTPEQYFREAAARGAAIPVVKGELQHHARGCYSAHSETKLLMRRAEHRVIAAEKASVMAHRLVGLAWPQDELRASWERILWNSFHDVMGGCCIPEASEDTREFFGASLALSGTVLNRAAQAVSWAVDTSKPGTKPLSRDKDWLLWEKGDLGAPVVVLNTHSWPVTAPVRVNRKAVSVTDDSGTPVALQLVRASRTHEGPHDSVFLADVPALGWRVYWIHRDREQPAVPTHPARVPAPGVMENGMLRASFDTRTGALSSLVDLRTGTECLAGPAAVPLVIDESMHNTWAHDAVSFDIEAGRFTVESVETLDQGPVVARIRVTSRHGASTLRQDFLLHAGSPVLEVNARLLWLEKQRMLKLSVPAWASDPVATWEIPYGAIQRPADGAEESGQEWIDVTGRGPGGAARGLSLLNNGKYGSDVRGGEMRMTVARSPVAADTERLRDASSEYLDQGIQEFRWALLPHAGSWQDAGVVRAARELNEPPVRILETYHEGPLPRACEGVRISDTAVIVTAFKRAEDGGGYILRCLDSGGRGARALVELPLLGRRFTAELPPFSLRTFRIPDDPSAPVVETGIVERAEDDHAL